MIDYVSTEIQVMSLPSAYPDSFEFPVAGYGEEGGEEWYIYFPEELIALNLFTYFDYNLQIGQSFTTTATVYQFDSYEIRPNAYAFFDTGNFAIVDNETLPVYMVIVAKYRSTDTLGYGDHTYVNSVSTYGVAYYAYNGLTGSDFYASRLDIGYVPSMPSFGSGGILGTLYNIGQYLLNSSSNLLDLLNADILGIKLWQILFGSGFTIYASAVILKWLTHFV